MTLLERVYKGQLERLAQAATRDKRLVQKFLASECKAAGESVTRANLNRKLEHLVGCLARHGDITHLDARRIILGDQ